MCCEQAQLCSDALRTYGYEGDDIYKGAYHNHPSTKWVRKNNFNFNWGVAHGLALCDMYTRRTGKVHASQKILERCAQLHHLIPDDGTNTLVLLAEDLAIKSTDTGLASYHMFLDSDQSLDEAIMAYQRFYFSKPYVHKDADQLRRIKLLAELESQQQVIYTLAAFDC